MKKSAPLDTLQGIPHEHAGREEAKEARDALSKLHVQRVVDRIEKEWIGRGLDLQQLSTPMAGLEKPSKGCGKP